MKIYSIASEVEPFAKTGGLADVAAALPKALSGLGHDVRIVMPLYRQVQRERWGVRPTPQSVSVRLGPVVREARVWEGLLPKSGVVPPPVASPKANDSAQPNRGSADHATGGGIVTYFIECAPLFDRDGLYQVSGADHPDNLERFSVFSQAALGILPRLRWQPDLVHCHDWQAALACAQLAFGAAGQDPFFASMGTVLTIHNLAYQGLFPKAQWPLTQLPGSVFTMQGLEFYDQVNCLKGGLVSAGMLTTVSPTYVQEIQTAEFGCGLEGVLAQRRNELVGILNGIDMEAWNPQTDPHLATPYSAAQPAGKSLCKLALQRSQRLPERHDLLIGMIQRLAEQKGIDLLAKALEELMGLPIQLVILGTGDPRYHEELSQAAAKFPDRLAVNLKFDDALAHQIEAGADAFLMPSRFEPCGLNQMYSMRFGTVPIVRRVGGLADTVVDLAPATRAEETATGFVIDAHTADALVDAVQRALAAFRDHALWAELVQAGMRQDFSWGRSAKAYVDVYTRAVAKRRGTVLVPVHR